MWEAEEKKCRIHLRVEKEHKESNDTSNADMYRNKFANSKEGRKLYQKED